VQPLGAESGAPDQLVAGKAARREHGLGAAREAQGQREARAHAKRRAHLGDQVHRIMEREHDGHGRTDGPQVEGAQVHVAADLAEPAGRGDRGAQAQGRRVHDRPVHARMGRERAGVEARGAIALPPQNAEAVLGGQPQQRRE